LVLTATLAALRDERAFGPVLISHHRGRSRSWRQWRGSRTFCDERLRAGLQSFFPAPSRGRGNSIAEKFGTRSMS